MREICATQRSVEWYAARCGKITASHLEDVVTGFTVKETKRGAKGIETAKRRRYKIQLVAERLTGLCSENFVSKYMDWGNEKEPKARRMFEQRSPEMVMQTGFILHPRFDFFGASPDGLIGDSGILEIKNPEPTTHIEYLLANVLPGEYEWQLHGEILCAEADFGIFLSVDDRQQAPTNLFQVRVERDEDKIEKIESAVQRMEDEIGEIIHQLGAKVVTPRANQSAWQETVQPDDYDPSKPFAEQDYSFLGADEVVP